MKRFLQKFWARMYLRWSGVCLKHLQEKQPYTLDGETIHELCPSCESERQMLSMFAKQKAAGFLRKDMGLEPPSMPVQNMQCQTQSTKGWN